MNKEKVIHKGKTRIWIGSILAALVAAVAVFAVMMQMERELLSQYERGEIFVASREIPEGMLITAENYWDYFAVMELDKKCIPGTALSAPEQVQEMVVVADIDKGALLTAGMFETINDITKEMQEPVIAGFRAEDLYQVVGGVLRRGDRIHIYQLTEEGTAVLNWENVFVQQVFDNGGVSIGGEDKETAALRINVYLEQADVEQFYTQLAMGTIRVVKVAE